MTTTDLDLVRFLSAHPTFSLEEAASELGRRPPPVADRAGPPVRCDRDYQTNPRRIVLLPTEGLPCPAPAGPDSCGST